MVIFPESEKNNVGSTLEPVEIKNRQVLTADKHLLSTEQNLKETASAS